jgi:hypothetical protein
MKQMGLALHNYHSANGSFPMGASSGMWTLGVYRAKQNFSAHAAMLPFLELASVYNAINFYWGAEDSNCVICFQINYTAHRIKVNTFCCPSDPNAGVPDHNGDPDTNNYYGCIGTTTWLTYPANTAIGPYLTPTGPKDSSGIFTWQRSYRLATVTDGTSPFGTPDRPRSDRPGHARKPDRSGDVAQGAPASRCTAADGPEPGSASVGRPRPPG